MLGMTETTPQAPAAVPAPSDASVAQPLVPPATKKPLPPEVGGPTGPEPTRYGDWERKGRVSDF
jgi:hypothetical protein